MTGFWTDEELYDEEAHAIARRQAQEAEEARIAAEEEAARAAAVAHRLPIASRYCILCIAIPRTLPYSHP